MVTSPVPGQRVREIESGHEGVIDYILMDEGTLEFPNTIYVAFEDRLYGSFNDDNDGEWPELELVAL